MVASKLKQSTCVFDTSHRGKCTHAYPVVEKNKAYLGGWGEEIYFKYFLLWFTTVAEHLEKPSKRQSPSWLKKQVTISITIYSPPNV